MKAAVIGTSGYTGLILLRLLANHPHVDEIIPVSSSQYGKNILSIDPGTGENIINKCTSTSAKCISIEEAVKLNPDIVFACLPHLKSAVLCKPFFGTSIVIDLSADLRLNDPLVFEKAYNAPVSNPALLDKAVYGLSEWNYAKIKTADIIANPGCYPTASLLPLLPPVKEGFVKGICTINAISGISGAGKKLKEYLLFCERTESIWAYSPGTTHRHTPEIQQEISLINDNIKILFTPHLAPLKRGMVATATVQLTQQIIDKDLQELYKSYYSECRFIRINQNIPSSRDVWGSNRCDISWHIEDNTLMLFSAIDNLIKGASGQAIQNMNIRFGFPEESGLAISNQV